MSNLTCDQLNTLLLRPQCVRRTAQHRPGDDELRCVVSTILIINSS